MHFVLWCRFPKMPLMSGIVQRLQLLGRHSHLFLQGFEPYILCTFLLFLVHVEVPQLLQLLRVAAGVAKGATTAEPSARRLLTSTPSTSATSAERLAPTTIVSASARGLLPTVQTAVVLIWPTPSCASPRARLSPLGCFTPRPPFLRLRGAHLRHLRLPPQSTPHGTHM